MLLSFEIRGILQEAEEVSRLRREVSGSDVPFDQGWLKTEMTEQYFEGHAMLKQAVRVFQMRVDSFRMMRKGMWEQFRKDLLLELEKLFELLNHIEPQNTKIEPLLHKLHRRKARLRFLMRELKSRIEREHSFWAEPLVIHEAYSMVREFAALHNE